MGMLLSPAVRPSAQIAVPPSRRSIGLALFAIFVTAAPAYAQIISIMDPAANRRTGVHLMAGFADWTFPFNPASKQQVLDDGGQIQGDGSHGFIIAGDVAVRAGTSWSVGGGGWYNKVEPHILSYPDGNPNADTPIFFAYDITSRASFYSLYGNVFYKRIGVQGGVVPVRSHETVEIEFTGSGTDDFSQTDSNVFVVGRFGQEKWSATAGAGLHRYGSRAAGEIFYLHKDSPAATAATAFVNAAVKLGAGFSVDGSVWYTAADKNADTPGIGNASQTRITIGIGYGR